MITEANKRKNLCDGANVLSLFDGMSCGMLAMMSAGVKVDRYVAYEIDKYAVKTSLHNFPEIEQKGDVFAADFSQYKGFDFLVGGSPCVFWSISQKKNRETEARGLGWDLFSQYVRALKEVKPRYFVYENNKSMSNAIRDSIRKAFGFDEICINSALVSAQVRRRYYWVGKYNPETDWYDRVNIEQPSDRGIVLQDVLDGAIPVNAAAGNKSYGLTSHLGGRCIANFMNGGGHFPQPQSAESVRIGTYPNSSKNQGFDSKQYRIYSICAKATTQCGQGGVMGAKTGLYAVPVDASAPIDQYATPCEWVGGAPTRAVSGADGKIYAVYRVKDGQITINNKTYPIKLVDGYYIIRKLTVSECKRLQTVPEWYEFPVSNTRAYQLLGNGWTVEVISWLIKSILREN